MVNRCFHRTENFQKPLQPLLKCSSGWTSYILKFRQCLEVSSLSKQSSVLEMSKVTQCQIQQICWMAQDNQPQFFWPETPRQHVLSRSQSDADVRDISTEQPLSPYNLNKHQHFATCNNQSEQHPRREVPPEYRTV